ERAGREGEDVGRLASAGGDGLGVRVAGVALGERGGGELQLRVDGERERLAVALAVAVGDLDLERRRAGGGGRAADHASGREVQAGGERARGDRPTGGVGAVLLG